MQLLRCWLGWPGFCKEQDTALARKRGREGARPLGVGLGVEAEVERPLSQRRKWQVWRAAHTTQQARCSIEPKTSWGRCYATGVGQGWMRDGEARGKGRRQSPRPSSRARPVLVLLRVAATVAIISGDLGGGSCLRATRATRIACSVWSLLPPLYASSCAVSCSPFLLVSPRFSSRALPLYLRPPPLPPRTLPRVLRLPRT